VRAFRLGDAAFGRLAAGRPDAATLDELRRAQLSRHLLQLREILRAADGQPPIWYADLTAAPPEAARAALADPMTGLYAAAVRRGDLPADARPSLRPSPARTLTATHDGLTLRVRLEDTDPLRDRLGLTPTGPLSAAAAAHWQRHLDGAWRILVSRHRPDAIRLAAVLQVIVPVEPDPAAGGISATSADAFGAVAMSPPVDDTTLAVGLLHESAHSILNATHFLFTLVTPAGPHGYSPWRDDPRPAIGVLHGAYAYLAVTRFWRTEAAAHQTPSYQDPAHQTPAPQDPAPQDPAPQDPAPQASVHQTPGNPTPGNPTPGNPTPAQQDRAHETAARQAWAGGATWGGRAATSGASSAGRVAAFEFARWRAAVVEAADGLLGGGELNPTHQLPGGGELNPTHQLPGGGELGAAGGLVGGGVLSAAGVRFVGALRDEAVGWLGEPVDDEVARLAAGANADHRARWRLRNLEVDSGALVAAWRAGQGAPPLPPATLREGSGRVLPHSERLTRIHERLRVGGERKGGPWPGGGVWPGDDAWLGGRHGSARTAYLQVLENDASVSEPRPGDARGDARPGGRHGSARDAESAEESAWSGLAVVSVEAVVRERPELVRAVHRAVGGSLSEVIAWLARSHPRV
jgi:hypothetical protein